MKVHGKKKDEVEENKAYQSSQNEKVFQIVDDCNIYIEAFRKKLLQKYKEKIELEKTFHEFCNTNGVGKLDALSKEMRDALDLVNW